MSVKLRQIRTSRTSSRRIQQIASSKCSAAPEVRLPWHRQRRHCHAVQSHRRGVARAPALRTRQPRILPDVLRRDFDHQPELLPTDAQTDVFAAQYDPTLERYHTGFHTVPPTDIWRTPKFTAEGTSSRKDDQGTVGGRRARHAAPQDAHRRCSDKISRLTERELCPSIHEAIDGEREDNPDEEGRAKDQPDTHDSRSNVDSSHHRAKRICGDDTRECRVLARFCAASPYRSCSSIHRPVS